MRSTPPVQLITADALRAAIRAVGLLQDIRRNSSSLPRGLLATNGAAPLGRELGRLRGLADLLTPVSTTAEAEIRARRLNRLFSLLPQVPTLLETAQELDSQLSGKARFLSSSVRGELIAADEFNLRGLEEKLRRQYAEPGAQGLRGQLQAGLTLLHAESSSWRLLENTRLTNRLIADHGFADTYAQARKRARAVIREQASKGRSRPKSSDVRDLKRWHDAVLVQLESLVGARTASTELHDLYAQLQRHGMRLGLWLNLVRLRSALVALRCWKDSSESMLEALSTEIVVSLQACYGASKPNFRALIESEIETIKP